MKNWTCCRKSGCPEVALEGETIFIKDDFGGQVKLSVQDFEAVMETLHTLAWSQSECCQESCGCQE